MFMQPPLPPAQSNIVRPIILGLVLLFLFMTLQSDWSPGHSSARTKGETRSLQGPGSPTQSSDTHKEKILYDLALMNEKLEAENARLKQYVLGVRRAARAVGLQLNESAEAVFPELQQAIGEGELRADAVLSKADAEGEGQIGEEPIAAAASHAAGVSHAGRRQAHPKAAHERPRLHPQGGDGRR
eukprot:jgi/Botrbrau1/2958/Bobra.0026s0026.2